MLWEVDLPAHEATPSVEATWKEQFPYAHEYIRQSVFYDTGQELDFPRQWTGRHWDDSGSSDFISPTNCLDLECTGRGAVATTEPLQVNTSCPTFYWEVEISTRDLIWGLVEIGYSNMSKKCTHKFVYFGCVESVPENQKELRLIRKDTIGCGLYHSGGTFFTRNGILISRSSYPVIDSDPRGCMRICSRSSTTIKIRANLGQEPFLYDIVAHCKSSCGFNPQRLAVFPLEVVEEILISMLSAIEADIISANPIVVQTARRALDRIPHVCPRWHTICRRYIFRTLRLACDYDTRYTISQPLLWSSRQLTTQEPSESPWIHCLFTSPLPNRLICTDQWDHTSSQCVVFNQGLPAGVSHAIPALLRRGCFASITRLNLTSLRFPTWLQFARFVLSIRQLDELTLRDVVWDQDEVPPSPPSWLRFSRRIRSITVDSFMDNGAREYASGLICLLFAGRGDRGSSASVVHSQLQLLPRDIGVVANVTHTLCWMTVVNRIDYRTTSATHCTITCPQANSHDPALVLEFARHPHEPTYRLIHISVRFSNVYLEAMPALFKRLVGSLLRLSNRADCSFRFDIQGLQAPDRATLIRQQLIICWCIHNAVRDGLRVEATVYEPATWSDWQDEGSRPIFLVREKGKHKAGDTVTVLWAVPPQSRVPSPVALFMIRILPAGRRQRIAAEYSVQYLADFNMGVADVVWPEPTVKSAHYAIQITLDEHVCYTEACEVEK